MAVDVPAPRPVSHLSGVAQRLHCCEAEMRHVLFEEAGGMYPELVTRSELEVLLSPSAGGRGRVPA